MKLFQELKHLSAFEGSIVEKLLNSKVTVSIKIDTAAFVVMRDDDRVRFFSRQGKQEIDLNKRAVNAMYETHIAHVLKNDRWKALPNRFKVFTELFLPNLPSIIKYTKTPKNDLIISYVTDESGRVLKPDHPVVTQCAKILDIATPGIIFSGKISGSAKAQLQEYLVTGEHNKTSFLEFVFSLFTAPKELQWLVEDGFEGVVLYFGDDDAPIMAKLVDPNFTDTIKSKKADDSDESSYSMEIADAVWGSVRPLISWIDKTAKDIASGKKKVSGATSFLQICGAIAGQLVNLKGKEMAERLSKHQDEVVGTRFFQLSPNLVPKGINALTYKFWFAQDVFSVLVNTLRNRKTRVNPFKGIDAQRKDTIKKIIEIIDANGLGATPNLTDEALSLLEASKNDGLMVIAGRFQPLHNGHLKMSKKGLGFPTYVIIKGAKSSDNKSKNPFSENDQKRWIKKVFGSKANVVIASNGYLPKIIEDVESQTGQKVIEVVAGPDRITDYQRQISKTEYKDVTFVALTERFTTDSGLGISATAVRNAIREGNVEAFKQLMPPALYSEFDYMKEILDAS